ncbi:uncharacterized protein Fot_52046 [Forsythia ovata]|uniref:Uncharacterized protein n=1 Tax=Forsythia ovata TaxID=205694 RepID=A0ABD1PJK8_9LAMI
MDRVVEELRAEENSEDFYGEFDPSQSREKSAIPNDQQEEYISRIEEKEDGDSEDDNEDFEFAFLTRESQISSPISTDEIFCNGQIRPVFPIFERDLLLRNMNLKRENLGENGTENSGSSKGPSRTDLMNRSHSDGSKHTFALLTPTNSGKQSTDDGRNREES